MVYQCEYKVNEMSKGKYESEINTRLLSLIELSKISYISGLSHGYESRIRVLDNTILLFPSFRQQEKTPEGCETMSDKFPIPCQL